MADLDKRLQIPMSFEMLKAFKAKADEMGIKPGTLGRIYVKKMLEQEQGE